MSTKLAHIHDPQVSYDAAYNLSPVASEAAMHLIVDLIARHGPLTPKELERIYGQRRFTEPDWPTVAPFSIAKRASEMKVHIGVLTGTGVRRERAEALALTAEVMTVHTRITKHWEGKNDE